MLTDILLIDKSCCVVFDPVLNTWSNKSIVSRGKSYSEVPEVSGTDPSSIVHKFIPLFAHSIVNKFKERLAVAKS